MHIVVSVRLVARQPVFLGLVGVVHGRVRIGNVRGHLPRLGLHKLEQLIGLLPRLHDVPADSDVNQPLGKHVFQTFSRRQ